jgi:hypothetical protein
MSAGIHIVSQCTIFIAVATEELYAAGTCAMLITAPPKRVSGKFSVRYPCPHFIIRSKHVSYPIFLSRQFLPSCKKQHVGRNAPFVAIAKKVVALLSCVGAGGYPGGAAFPGAPPARPAGQAPSPVQPQYAQGARPPVGPGAYPPGGQFGQPPVVSVLLSLSLTILES